MQFREMMAPGKPGMPGAVETALTEAFGSVDEVEQELAAGAGQTALVGCNMRAPSTCIAVRNRRPADPTNFIGNLASWDAVAARM